MPLPASLRVQARAPGTRLGYDRAVLDDRHARAVPPSALVLLSTASGAAYLCTPGFQRLRDGAHVVLSAAVRDSLGAAVDAPVAVEVFDRPRLLAASVTVALPADGHSVPEPVLAAYLKDFLHGRWLAQAGNKGSISLFGRPVPFTIAALSPPCSLVHDDTAVHVTTAAAAPAPAQGPGDTGFQAIGGLQPVLDRLRALIKQSIDAAALLERGFRPPRGVLLHGPPGTGKTMLAKAVASELGASFVVVNGPELVSRFYGESERALRAVFDRAAAALPAVVFLDEVDSLAPKRDNAGRHAEARLVAALLAAIDAAPVGVTVLAATNRPDAIDPALRRPGRFDQEIAVPVPTRDARREILAVHLARIPAQLSADDIDAVADRTHGFVGADLAALCREASLAVIKARRELVVMRDLCDALARVKPSALREFSVEVPRVLWTDIGGQQAIQQRLREAIELPLRDPQAFERMGIRPPKGVLLYGPPGCSKTMMAKALATEAQLNFIAVKGPELFSQWVGDSEKAVRTVFQKARATAPTIVFFDEIDALAVQRGGDPGSGAADRVLSQLLGELDGIDRLNRVTVVAATNRPDMIDAALLRPGRLDRLIYVGPPSAPSRKEIFAVHLRRTPLADDVDMDALVAQTDGFSGAEIMALCRAAAFDALAGDMAAETVRRANFDAALKQVRPQITDEMIRFYERFEEGSRR